MAMIVLSILTETKELLLLQKFQATGMTDRDMKNGHFEQFTPTLTANCATGYEYGKILIDHSLFALPLSQKIILQLVIQE